MRLARLTLTFVLVCISAGSLAAQTAAPRLASSLLQRTAHLDVRNVSLEAALRELWRRSTVPLAFSPDMLDDGSRVSCACESATVREALDTLLVGTGLQFEENGRRVVVRPIPPEPETTHSEASPVREQEHGWVLGQVWCASDSQPILGAQAVVGGLPGEVRTKAYRKPAGPNPESATARQRAGERRRDYGETTRVRRLDC